MTSPDVSYREFKEDVAADVSVGCVRSEFDTERIADAVSYCDSVIQRATAAEAEVAEKNLQLDMLRDILNAAQERADGNQAKVEQQEREIHVIQHDLDWARDLLKRALDESNSLDAYQPELSAPKLRDEISEFFQTTLTAPQPGEKG